jgi:hypothetical protein
MSLESNEKVDDFSFEDIGQFFWIRDDTLDDIHIICEGYFANHWR